MIHGNDFEKTPVCLAQNVAVAGYNNNCDRLQWHMLVKVSAFNLLVFVKDFFWFNMLYQLQPAQH